MKAQDNPRRRRDTERASQLVAGLQRLLEQRPPFPFVAFRQRQHDFRGRPAFASLRRGKRFYRRHRRRDEEAGEISFQDIGSAAAIGCEPGRADDTQPDAVPRSPPGELIDVASALYVEDRALDVLPAQRAANRNPELLPGNAVGRQTGDAELAHAS